MSDPIFLWSNPDPVFYERRTRMILRLDLLLLKFGESNPYPVFSQRLDPDHFKVPFGASMLATLHLCVQKVVTYFI